MAKRQNMAMVLQALKNAGLNDNQARILGAEIGRENSFRDKYLWGYHSDPKNKAVNIGIISWQGVRGRGVENALRNAGLIKNGKIVKGQESLDVMAKYLVNEIKTEPSYAATRKQFLENPDVDYRTGAQVLGRNFIRWRYDDPKYAHGHKNRDTFYKQLGGVEPTSSLVSSEGKTSGHFNAPRGVPPPPNGTSMFAQDFPTQTYDSPQYPLGSGAPQAAAYLLGGNDQFGTMGLNLDLMDVLRGMGATQSVVAPMLPTPFS